MPPPGLCQASIPDPHCRCLVGPPPQSVLVHPTFTGAAEGEVQHPWPPRKCCVPGARLPAAAEGWGHTVARWDAPKRRTLGVGEVLEGHEPSSTPHAPDSKFLGARPRTPFQDRDASALDRLFDALGSCPGRSILALQPRFRLLTSPLLPPFTSSAHREMRKDSPLVQPGTPGLTQNGKLSSLLRLGRVPFSVQFCGLFRPPVTMQA